MRARFVIAIAAVLVVFGLAVFYHFQPAPPALPQVDSLATKRSVKPRLPAPRIRATTPSAAPPTGDVPATNLIARLLKEGDSPKISLEQAEAYLQQNGRQAATLLAAWQATGDRSFMREAMEKYPNDPRVAFTVACLYNSFGSDEENAKGRRQWLEAFKSTAPDNALADYLSASEHFRSGQADQAMKDLLAVGNKSIQDYALDFVQNSQEAYLSAGYSEAEAKAIASSSLLLPQLAQFKQVGLNLVEMAKVYQQAGDTASAQAALQIALSLGQRLDGSGTLNIIQSRVGVAVQRIALSAMDPNTPFGDSGQTVQNEIDMLNQRQDTLKATMQKVGDLLPTMSEQDLTTYFDRLKLFGEEATLRWAVDRFGQP